MLRQYNRKEIDNEVEARYVALQSVLVGSSLASEIKILYSHDINLCECLPRPMPVVVMGA